MNDVNIINNDKYVINGKLLSSHLGGAMGQVRDDKILVRIALVLKDLRDELGVSQEEVYNDTNIHIGRIESCSSNPTISTLSVLAKYFNVKLSEFFKRVESKSEYIPQ